MLWRGKAIGPVSTLCPVVHPLPHPTHLVERPFMLQVADRVVHKSREPLVQAGLSG